MGRKKQPSLTVTVPLLVLSVCLLPLATATILVANLTHDLSGILAPYDDVMLEVTDALIAHRNVLLLILLGFTLVLTAGAVYGSIRLRSILREFVRWSTRSVDGGEDDSLPLEGSRELSRLARALNRMVRLLHRKADRVQESESRFRQLIEAMSEGFLIADPTDRITFVNRRFAQMIQWPQESLLGLEVQSLLDDMNRRVLEEQEESRRNGEAGRYELTWNCRRGDTLTTLVSASPLLDRNGEYQGSFAVITDLTDRRRLEEQMSRSEKLRALGEMAGGIAHDFNNRLTAILGNAQLLLADTEDDGQSSSLRIIEQAALEGAETVRRIMEFTRTRPDAVREDLDVNDVISEVLELLRFRWKDEAQETGRTFDLRKELLATRPVSAHPSEIREALINVIANAFDAMPDGGELTLSTCDRADGVEVMVADSGHGMSRTTLSRVFDPFFTTRGIQSTGLGLSITYGILKRHGGKLMIESSEGVGTEVTILMPAGKPASADKSPRESREEGPASPSLRILVVDDEAGVAEVLKLALSRAGHQVETAAQGEEAVRLLRAGGAFDVVVTDLGMPGVTGSEVAAEAKKQLPDAKVLVVTGFGSDTEEKLNRLPFVDRVLKKPFSVPDLLKTVESLAETAPVPEAQKTSTK